MNIFIWKPRYHGNAQRADDWKLFELQRQFYFITTHSLTGWRESRTKYSDSMNVCLHCIHNFTIQWVYTAQWCYNSNLCFFFINNYIVHKKVKFKNKLSGSQNSYIVSMLSFAHFSMYLNRSWHFIHAACLWQIIYHSNRITRMSYHHRLKQVSAIINMCTTKSVISACRRNQTHWNCIHT